MADLCEGCWNDFANNIAEYEGATAPPRPEPGPDDFDHIEPPTCPECHGLLRHFPTNYDRWIYLASRECPAKEIPSRYRWRVMDIAGRYSPVAVRIGATQALPGEIVVPAHVAVCHSPDAIAAVEEAWKADLRRAHPGGLDDPDDVKLRGQRDISG